MSDLKEDILKHLQKCRNGKIPSNAWFEDETIKVYIRCHSIRAWTVDVANVEVNEKLRGTGVYRRFLDWLENEAKKAGYEYILFENTFERRLESFHLRAGATREGRYYPHSFRKKIV